MDSNSSVPIPLLSVLSPKDRANVLAYAKGRTYQPGDFVVSDGDPGMYLFFVTGTRGSNRSARAGSGDWSPATTSESLR